MTYTHANPRFYVGPIPNEIVVGVGRAYGVQLGGGVGQVTITFQRRPAHDNTVSVWDSYAVKDGFARFEVPESFRTNLDDYPTGFYDGVVTIGECEIGDVELVKAPGHYLGDAESIQDRCHGEDTWVEPKCPIDEPVNTCECGYSDKSQCPTCYNEVNVAKIDLIIDYAGLNEIETCTPPDNQE